MPNWWDFQDENTVEARRTLRERIKQQPKPAKPVALPTPTLPDPARIQEIVNKYKPPVVKEPAKPDANRIADLVAKYKPPEKQGGLLNQPLTPQIASMYSGQGYAEPLAKAGVKALQAMDVPRQYTGGAALGAIRAHLTGEGDAIRAESLRPADLWAALNRAREYNERPMSVGLRTEQLPAWAQNLPGTMPTLPGADVANQLVQNVAQPAMNTAWKFATDVVTDPLNIAMMPAVYGKLLKQGGMGLQATRGLYAPKVIQTGKATGALGELAGLTGRALNLGDVAFSAPFGVLGDVAGAAGRGLRGVAKQAGDFSQLNPLARAIEGAPAAKDLPTVTPADSMVDVIALSSPSGKMSAAALKRAQARNTKAIFGEGGLKPPQGPELDMVERLRRQAEELRQLADRGMHPISYKKKALELEAQADALSAKAAPEVAGTGAVAEAAAPAIDDLVALSGTTKLKMKYAKDDRLITGKVKGKSFWADGFILDMGDPPKALAKSTRVMEGSKQMSEMIKGTEGVATMPATSPARVVVSDTFVDRPRYDAHGVPVKEKPKPPLHDVVVLTGPDGQRVALQSKYYGYFAGKYADAEFLMSTPESPVLIRSKGKTVGITMPYKIKDTLESAIDAKLGPGPEAAVGGPPVSEALPVNAVGGVSKQVDLDAIVNRWIHGEHKGAPINTARILNLYSVSQDEARWIYDQVVSQRNALTPAPKVEPAAEVPAAPVAKPTKEPWQMTQAEYVASKGFDPLDLPTEQLSRQQMQGYPITRAALEHEKAVSVATKQGKPVPREVLVEYARTPSAPVAKPLTKKQAEAQAIEVTKKRISEALASGEPVYISPQFRVDVGDRDFLINTSVYVQAQGGEHLGGNKWQKKAIAPEPAGARPVEQAAPPQAAAEVAPVIESPAAATSTAATPPLAGAASAASAQPQPTVPPAAAAPARAAPPAPPQTPPARAAAAAVPSSEDPVQKIIVALRKAKPLRREQEAVLYRAARKEKFAKMMSARGRVGGEAGFRAELGSLKGDLPKMQFEDLRKSLTQTDIDGLFNRINESRIGEWEKVNAKTGLSKMLGEGAGGSVPTKGEIALLDEVFGKEFTDALLDKRSLWQKFMAISGDLLNVPRSLMASFDLSAPLRQGVFLVGRPKQWGPAFGTMFKAMSSENAYKSILDDIAARPSYELMREYKLALTRPTSVLAQGEEAFMSNLAANIPGIGIGVKASDRAYSGFLNKLRADVFDDILKQGQKLGLGDDPKFLESLASFVNAATGRGNMPDALSSAHQVLNGALFSPRLMASRLSLLNPVYYAKLQPTVRKEALKSLFTFAAAGTTVLTMAKLAGAEVGTDPRSTDFGKIKIGDTRFDPWGGFQQYVVVAARLLTNEMVSSTTGKEYALGEGYKPTTRMDIAQRFVEAKQAPVLSFATALLEGSTFSGEKVRVAPEIADRFIPMVIQDLYELHRDGELPELAAIPGFFGVGVQTYGDQIPMNAKTASGADKIEWRQPPGLGETILNKITGTEVSDIPESEWGPLYKDRMATTMHQIEVDKAKKIALETGEQQQVGDTLVYMDNGVVKSKTVKQQAMTGAAFASLTASEIAQLQAAEKEWAQLKLSYPQISSSALMEAYKKVNPRGWALVQVATKLRAQQKKIDEAQALQQLMSQQPASSGAVPAWINNAVGQ